MNTNYEFNFQDKSKPIIAAAIHDGHSLRQELLDSTSLTDSQRLREEDPFTAMMACAFENHLLVKTSRFEVDLNRSRDKAIYRVPDDAWGLTVWNKPPDHEAVVRSLSIHDSFYQEIKKIFSDVKKRHTKFIVLDIHSYNHRRQGPEAAPADQQQNPDVNIGTGTMLNHMKWRGVTTRFIKDISQGNSVRGPLDVRENIKFKGGYFAKYLHETFPDSVCVLSVEFKKLFMDEWSGEPDHSAIAGIKKILQDSIPGLLQEIEKI